MAIIPRWVCPKMNTYMNMLNVFTEPKMLRWASCAGDAQIKDVTEACAPQSSLEWEARTAAPSQCPQGRVGNGLSGNTSPENRGEARAGHLGKQQTKKNPALSEDTQEQKAGVKVLGMELLTDCLAPWGFPIPSPGTRTRQSQDKGGNGNLP